LSDIRKRQTRRKPATQSHGSTVVQNNHDRQAAEDYTATIVFARPGLLQARLFCSGGLNNLQDVPNYILKEKKPCLKI